MAIPKHKRGRATDRVAAEFDISSAALTRMRFVYKEHLLGVPYATTLIGQIDAGVVTPSEAERLLKLYQDDHDLSVSVSSVKLPDLVQQLLKVDPYIRVVRAALRQGVRLDVGKMSEAEVSNAIDLVRDVGNKMIQTAELLDHATTSGGATAHG